MNDLVSQLKPFEDAARNLEGWVFEYEPENINGGVPWDYVSLAATLVSTSNSVIDLGTGGGESFSNILKGKLCQAFASEEWERNAPIAAQRLKGVAPVTRCSSLSLPFSAESFDLVLSRHEAIDPTEVSRVLRPSGCFLSQQVIHDFMFELRDTFPDATVFPNFFLEYQKEFKEMGLSIVRAQEFRYKIRFKSLGHLVYQLAATPWTIEGFSISTHLDGLSKLSERLEEGDELIFTAGYSLLEVRK